MSSLPKTMRTAVMEDIQKIGHVIRPLPEASEHEVIVKIEHVGISFYDLTYYATGRIQDFVAVPPFVLGREAGGKVVFCGEDVNHLKVGDTVALEPILFCGTCELCKIGHYHLCQEERIFGSPPLDGFFSEFVVHPACLTHKVPNSLDSLDASLIEPMAIGFHAAKLTEAKLGQRVVIFGAGA
ncbi:MAG: alcohol dehydrogenase catalytic domain-containing protein, partial [Deltaproteobacteria bacterium]|nr:alcohol dehydrogenase catalytic domain-containing protein [Deltaproteobacteria bacterium]